MEIMDPHLVFGYERDHQMEEYMTSVLGINVTCSIESPRDRMEMGDVTNKLQSYTVYINQRYPENN